MGSEVEWTRDSVLDIWIARIAIERDIGVEMEVKREYAGKENIE